MKASNQSTPLVVQRTGFVSARVPAGSDKMSSYMSRIPASPLLTPAFKRGRN